MDTNVYPVSALAQDPELLKQLEEVSTEQLKTTAEAAEDFSMDMATAMFERGLRAGARKRMKKSQLNDMLNHSKALDIRKNKNRDAKKRAEASRKRNRK